MGGNSTQVGCAGEKVSTTNVDAILAHVDSSPESLWFIMLFITFGTSKLWHFYDKNLSNRATKGGTQ